MEDCWFVCFFSIEERQPRLLQLGNEYSQPFFIGATTLSDFAGTPKVKGFNAKLLDKGLANRTGQMLLL
jgi:hypothetical protein